MRGPNAWGNEIPKGKDENGIAGPGVWGHVMYSMPESLQWWGKAVL